jgi:hypothetical protein
VQRGVPAQTVYSDGQLHTVKNTSGPIVVENNGTSLVVDSPASVTGTAGIQSGQAIVAGVGTTVNMLGGQVVGAVGANADNGPTGIVSNGLFGGFGGTVHGGNATATAAAGIGLDVNAGSAQIFGGTYRGGNASATNDLLNGQFGIFSTKDTNVAISGGTFVGGNGGNTAASGAPGAGAALLGNVSISGGTFQGGTLGGSYGARGLEEILGVDLGNGHFLPQTASISGGTFVHGVAPPHVGASAGFNVDFGSTLNISGGTFPSQVSILQSMGTVNISGGAFAAGPGNSFADTLDTSSTLNFFGKNLTLGEDFGSGHIWAGQVTGTLMDGTDLDIYPIIFSQATVYVSLIHGPQGDELTFTAGPSSVPEPASIVIMVLGMAGVAAGCAVRRMRVKILADQRVSRVTVVNGRN